MLNTKGLLHFFRKPYHLIDILDWSCCYFMKTFFSAYKFYNSLANEHCIMHNTCFCRKLTALKNGVMISRLKGAFKRYLILITNSENSDSIY